MPVIHVRPAFIRAVNARIAWLAEHRGEDELENFLSGLAEARRRIERHPEAGAPLRADAAHLLRLRLFPRPLPYFVYYGHPLARPVSEVYLVRLYGSGQSREELDMSEWPW